MNGMENRSQDIDVTSRKYTEELRSITSLLESVKQRVEQNELLVQKKMDQISLNMKEMRTIVVSMILEMETLQLKKSEDIFYLKVESFEWTIKDVAKIFLKDKWRFKSEAFKFTGYKYEIRAKLVKIGGTVGIYLQFKEGDKFNRFIDKDGFTKVKYIVKDQSDILKEQHIIRESYLRFHDCFGQDEWIFGCTIPGEMLSPPYVKDDCIQMAISFEPPSIDRSFVSNNGVLKWRVDNYESKKEEQLYHETWSPSFYTSPQGYRVKTRLLISFRGTMLVAVHFLTGEHDNSLPIDFPHKTTVTLFNQSDPSTNSVKSVQRNDLKLYAIQLESSKFIEENGFIKNDLLLLEIVIEPVVSK